MLASALGAAAGWLIEPADPAGPPEAARCRAPLEARPVVAVVGLSARCGATTVARAVGAELAARDPGGACVVTATGRGGSLPLGLPGAARLARRLGPLVGPGAGARAHGRLCLVEAADRAALMGALRYLAPLVLDVEDAADASAAAVLSDHVLLVGSPSTEPSLADVVAASLRRVGPDPLPVLNRSGRDAERWDGRTAARLPESRMGAQLALGGREPRGGLGRAIADLVDRCGEVR